MTWVRRLGRATVAAAIGLFLLALLLEIGLRLAGYGGIPAQWYDPDVGWRFLPNQEREMHSHTGELLGTVEVNELGFRGPAPRRAAEAGTTRIACLGDSFTHGWGVAKDQTYPRELERVLSEAGRRVEVLNFGQPGYNLWNTARLYEKVVRPIAPDVCVLGIYLNDAQPEAGGPRNTDALCLRMIGRTAIAEAFHRHLRRRIRWFDAGRTPEQKAWIAGYRDHWHEIENEPESAAGRPYWQAASESLAGLARACADDGAELGVVLFPRHQQWVDLRNAPEEAWPTRTKTQAFLAARARDLGLPVLDVLAPLLAADEDPYGPVDFGHPSPLGYSIIAAEVARFLEDEGLLASER